MKTTTITAALRTSGVFAMTMFDRATNGERFRAYVIAILVPVLRLGDTVILDNFPAHKIAGVRKAVQAAGARLLYLPPYSPDLKPIEQVFAKLRRYSAPPPHDPSPTSGRQSGRPSLPSPQTNVATTSPPLDTMHSVQHDRQRLQRLPLEGELRARGPSGAPRMSGRTST